MSHDILTITADPFAQGAERFCFLHPNDASKVIKIQKGESRKQTRRELEFYRKLSRRTMNDYRHIPRFYGRVQTNRGEGFIVDLISDFDGTVSRTMMTYFREGYPYSDFITYLDDLEQNLLDNRLMISADMVGRHNIVVQKTSDDQLRLVIVDGVGNHSAINWFDGFTPVAHSKIRRRWQRVVEHLERYSNEAMESRDLNPKTIEGRPRKTG